MRSTMLRQGPRTLGAVLTMLTLATAAGLVSSPSGAAASGSPVGAVAASTPMHVTLALRPRNPAALAAYARAVSTPGSRLYRDYLNTAKFARRFGATAGALAAVTASLSAHGLREASVSANHLSVAITASAAQVGRAFSLTFTRMALAGGKRAVAASAAPALDRQIAPDVEAVIGLSSVAAPRPQILRPGPVQPAADRLTQPAADQLTQSAADRLLRPAAVPSLVAASTPHAATDGPQACGAASDAAASQGGYTADQIASAYRFSGLYGAGAQGQGVTIALYELEPDDPADIAAYQSCYGTSAPVSYVRVDGGAGSGAGDGEAALDVENAIGLAPRASFLVYQGPNSGQDAPGSGPYDLLRQIVTDDRAQVISISWGSCEQLLGAGNLRATSTLLEEASAQGQSIVSATGDQGSEDCNQDNGLPNGSLAVDDPGSQPFVTAVGGTTLRALGPPPKERVWNNGGDPASPRGGAGGGGLSQIWAMPSYQSGAAASLRVIRQRSSRSACGNPSGHPGGDLGGNPSGRPGGNPSGFCREVPDVAADADPSTGYVIYWNGSGAAGPLQPSGWQEVAGTSGAAPLWAALLADADSSSACHGTRIGFANPALYRAASGSYGSYFNDIASGDNDFTGTGGGLYAASAGYDMASGLGTPKADTLAARLCDDALQVDNPGRQLSTLGKPLSFRVATNAPTAARLRFTARNLPAGLSISRSTGRISGRPRRTGSTLVTVAVTGPGLVLRSAAFIWKVVGPPGHGVGPRRHGVGRRPHGVGRRPHGVGTHPRPRGRRGSARAGARGRHLVGFGAE